MRTATLTSLLFVAWGYAANSQQLTLLPQVGFENSRTAISYNNLRSFAPLGGEFSPMAALRLDYKFKQGFGPYLTVSSSRSGVLFNFSDPENGMNNYNASRAGMQLRLEGGYQYSTKPIYFNRAKKSSGSPALQRTGQKKDCSSYYSRSNCLKDYSSSARCGTDKSKQKQSTAKNKGNWMSIQPSLGVGFIPSVKTDVTAKAQGGQTIYEYRAGNWNTALITGVGFEFGRNKQRLFNISINYFNGIGNLGRQTITTTSNSKTTVTRLQSDASGWNMKVGIPFTLAQKKTPARQKTEYKIYRPQNKCGQYKMTYKIRCRTMQ